MTNALRELRISTVQNGFIVSPFRYSDGRGDEAGTYVFTSVEQMAAWMLRQAWQLAGERE